ncbi:hypothetical protein ECFRIK2001_5084, partial [Escherichia coli FRIK2001]
MASAPVL